MFRLLPDQHKIQVGLTSIMRNKIIAEQRSRETHSNGISGVGFMVTSTRYHRLEGGNAIPIREEGTSAAIILIAGFLRHRSRPGIGQFALKAIIAKQYVGDALAFS